MFDAESLGNDHRNAQRATTDDSQLEARRRVGLRLVLEAREGQSLDELQTALKGLHPELEVEPLFPQPEFEPMPEGEGTPLDHRGFVATLAGLAADDLSQNVFDIAEGVRVAAAVVRAVPDMPLGDNGVLMGPIEVDAESFDAAGLSDAWALRSMRVAEAWSVLRRGAGEGVKIAHPDTGWTDHHEWTAGGLDKSLQRNFVETETPRDARDRLSPGHPGHGTHTAAVMACRGGIQPDYRGTTPPGRVTGVAPAALNVPLRTVTNVVIPPGYTELARAIRYSVEKRLPVISMSLGGVPLTLHKDIHDRAVDAVRAHHILVAASGNYPDEVPRFLRVTVEPAWWNFVIGVTASTPEDKAWDSSGRPIGVEISAPGHRVLTASGHNSRGYAYGSGTSYATAHLAGVAAMWLGHHFPGGYPQSAPEAVHVFKEHIRRTAREPEEWHHTFGPGIVDTRQLMVTRPNLNVELSEVEEYSHFVAIAHELAAESPDEVATLLGAALLHETGVSAEATEARLEPWLGEVRTLLRTDREVWQAAVDGLRRSPASAGSSPSPEAAAELRTRITRRASVFMRTGLTLMPTPEPEYA